MSIKRGKFSALLEMQRVSIGEDLLTTASRPVLPGVAHPGLSASKVHAPAIVSWFTM